MNKYYKWINPKQEMILIHVIGFDQEKNIGTADYFKNLKLHAQHQKFVPKEDDVEITEKEFNRLMNWD